MSSLIKRLLEIPFYLWIILAAGLGYKDYYDWESEVYEPLVQQKTGKEGELAELNKQAGKIEEFKRRKTEKLKELQDLGEKFKATADRLPRSANVPDLLKSLADIGDRSGLELAKFRPGAQERNQFLVINRFDVSLKGTYVQIMTFLDAAANLTRVISTEKLVIDGVQAKGPVNVVGATASLLTYYIEDTGIEGAVTPTGGK